MYDTLDTTALFKEKGNLVLVAVWQFRNTAIYSVLRRPFATSGTVGSNYRLSSAQERYLEVRDFDNKAVLRTVYLRGGPNTSGRGNTAANESVMGPSLYLDAPEGKMQWNVMVAPSTNDMSAAIQAAATAIHEHNELRAIGFHPTRKGVLDAVSEMSGISAEGTLPVGFELLS